MAPNEGMHALELLATVAVAGGFGGFADGLITKTEYVLRLPHLKGKAGAEVPRWSEIDFGTLGDVLIGAAASVAIFLVAGGLLSVDMQELSTPNGYMRVIALGVLAGFSGLRLLGGLSRQIVEDISKKTALETVKRETQKSADVAIFIKEADAILTEFDADCKSSQRPPANELESLLNKASAKYDAALTAEPANEQALRGKARVCRRQAELAKDQGKSTDAANFWKRGIAILSSILDSNDQSAPTYYNRACYKQLSGEKPDEVLADLTRAIGISPELKQYAQNDMDFAALRAAPKFKALTE